MSSVAAGTDVRRRSTSLTDRLVAAIPLASIYVWLSIVYCVEAWKRVTPWLFTDELEMTQISRSIAATGHPARRGEPYSFHSLYPVLTAPLWWIDNVPTAYSGIKYVDVFAMTAVVFPTYFLARLVVSPRWALFAAAGAGAIPALAYSSWLVEETFAYPFSAVCLFLITKALVTRGPWWIAAAVCASAVAPAVRGELVVIPIVAVLATLFALWSSRRAKRIRRSWSFGDHIGVIAIVAGVIIVISGYATWHVHQWQMTTSYNWTKKRIFVYGDWAAGAFMIGIGVIPFIAGLAALFRARGEHRSLEVRMFRSTAAAAVIGFGVYTAMKAAYLTMVFETRVEERNLIYIAPVLFIGTALILERRRVNLVALGAAAAYAFYLVVGTPFKMNVQLYSDALGLSILQQANRYFAWTPDTAQWLLLAILLVGTAALALIDRIRPPVLALATASVLALGIVGWNLTGELSAAAGTVSISRTLEQTLRHPFSWVDDVAQRKPTLYLAQGVQDQNPEWLLEFWNRSITTVSSLDSTIKGPGPAGAPNITTRGKLYWTVYPNTPGKVFDYAVEDWPCVDLAGKLRATHAYQASTQLKSWRLIELTKPNRLDAFCTGIYADGWTGANDSAYFRFTSTKRGWLRIRAERNAPPTPLEVQLAPIVAVHHTPQMGPVMRTKKAHLKTGKTTTIWLRTPPRPFSVKVVVANKFTPGGGDVRLLGAHVAYRYFTTRPRKAK